MDFARLVEVFDRNSVTVVSVKQSFNTTTTLLIIAVVILLLGGGGWYGRGRWY